MRFLKQPWPPAVPPSLPSRQPSADPGETRKSAAAPPALLGWVFPQPGAGTYRASASLARDSCSLTRLMLSSKPTPIMQLSMLEPP